MDSLCVEPGAAELKRDYLLAYLRLVLKSDSIGALSAAIKGLFPNGKLNVSTDAIWDVITRALADIPGIGALIGLGKGLLSVSATVDLSQLTNPIPSSANSALQLNLGDGSATIDLAALLGGAYTGAISPWLNTLTPNTRLFVDAGLPGDPVTALLNQWVTSLIDRLRDLLVVNISVGPVLGTGLQISGTLRQVLNGTATVNLTLAGLHIPLGSALAPLLSGVGNVIDTALTTLLSPTGALSGALAAVNVVLSALFNVLGGVLAITVNAQNDPTGGHTPPAYYSAVAPVGRYDVAALHLELLGVVNLLNLSVARGSVGNNTPR